MSSFRPAFLTTVENASPLPAMLLPSWSKPLREKLLCMYIEMYMRTPSVVMDPRRRKYRYEVEFPNPDHRKIIEDEFSEREERIKTYLKFECDTRQGKLETEERGRRSTGTSLPGPAYTVTAQENAKRKLEKTSKQTTIARGYNEPDINALRMCTVGSTICYLVDVGKSIRTIEL